MAIEDPPSNSSSPRLSFSRDLIQPDSPLCPHKPATSPATDFNFNVSVETSSAQDPSPADELFSDGKILPLPLRTPSPRRYPTANPDPIAGPGCVKGAGKKPLWKFGRSASLNFAPAGMIKRVKFFRSSSAGSDQNPGPNPKPKPQANPNPNAPHTKPIYYERDEGTSPVPLFPKGRGLIGFLLCSCVGGGNNNMFNTGMDYYCSP